MRNRLGLTTALLYVTKWTVPVGIYSVLSLWRSTPPFSYIPDIPVGLEAAVLFTMSLLIAFRINRAYERWWEARTLWGTLVNVSRNLAVKVKQIARPSATESAQARDLIVAFAIGLKDHLRDEVDLSRLPGIRNPKHQIRNKFE